MKRPRAAPAKDNGLTAGFIHYAIALESARDADCFAFGVMSRDQFWGRPRTESLCAGNCVRRNQLHDTQSIFSISHERKLRSTDAADLHRPRVAERATGIEHLIDEWSLRIFHIDNRESLRTVRDVGVSARDIQSAGMMEADGRTRNRDRPRRLGKIDNL